MRRMARSSLNESIRFDHLSRGVPELAAGIALWSER